MPAKSCFFHADDPRGGRPDLVADAQHLRGLQGSLGRPCLQRCGGEQPLVQDEERYAESREQRESLPPLLPPQKHEPAPQQAKADRQWQKRHHRQGAGTVNKGPAHPGGETLVAVEPVKVETHMRTLLIIGANHVNGTGGATHVLVVECRNRELTVWFEAGSEGMRDASFAGADS